jgi:hypothetical protein
MLTIDKIEGNSRIGVPVFSYAGRKSNFKILLFQPSYEDKQAMLMMNKNETPLQEQMRHYGEIGNYLTSEKDRIRDRLKDIDDMMKKGGPVAAANPPPEEPNGHKKKGSHSQQQST